MTIMGHLMHTKYDLRDKRQGKFFSVFVFHYTTKNSQCSKERIISYERKKKTYSINLFCEYAEYYTNAFWKCNQKEPNLKEGIVIHENKKKTIAWVKFDHKT